DAVTGGFYFVVVCSLSLQVVQRSGVVGKNCADCLATFQFRTVTAGRHAFLSGALTNTAKAFTIHRFHSIHAAALTV
ncbi:HTH cro/C1-type domain-containing protein, partial [Dysosmobacter welbionis]